MVNGELTTQGATTKSINVGSAPKKNGPSSLISPVNPLNLPKNSSLTLLKPSVSSIGWNCKNLWKAGITLLVQKSVQILVLALR